MRFHYEKLKDAFYIRFDESPYVESEEPENGIIFDYNKKGKLIGIEILDASKKLSASFKHLLSRKNIPIQIGSKIPV